MELRLGTGRGEQEEEKRSEREEEKQGEQELAFSLMTSLTDETKREAVWQLLRSLTNTVDEGKVSHVQLMVKIVADSSVAD